MATRFEHAYVLNVVSDDHPGIVAAVSAAVNAFGGNLDAMSQTVVKGYFTLLMIVSSPEPIDPSDLAAAVRNAGATPESFQVIARPARPVDAPEQAAPNIFVLTAFGKDRRNIIHEFSRYLAGKDINIIDLYGERTGEDFVLISQVEVPDRYDIAMLQAELNEIAGGEEVNVRLQHENIFVATNQLRLAL